MNLELSEDEITILQMALYEYINNRQIPTEKDYVAKRYEDMDQNFREKKLPSVIKNNQVASELRERLFERI